MKGPYDLTAFEAMFISGIAVIAVGTLIGCIGELIHAFIDIFNLRRNDDGRQD